MRSGCTGVSSWVKPEIDKSYWSMDHTRRDRRLRNLGKRGNMGNIGNIPRVEGGKTPLIMVSAGTGLAPFRAFLSERCQVQKIGKEIGPMILFFGCRNPSEDFIYREELEEIQQILGDKLRLVTAFSSLDGTPRQYVQDMVLEFGDEMVRLLDEGGSFYVCGRAGMAREVERAVGMTLRKVKGWTGDEMNDWSRAVKKNKWQEEAWGCIHSWLYQLYFWKIFFAGWIVEYRLNVLSLHA